MEVVDARQMRSIEERTVLEFGLPTLLLMENAGRQVASLAWQLCTDRDGGAARRLPAMAPVRLERRIQPRIVLCCGKGNNGGDGLCAARHLAAWGAEVMAVLWGQADELPPDAARNYQACVAGGVAVVPGGEVRDLPGLLRGADLVVDALLGTGVRGGVRGALADAIAAVNAAGRPVLAVDLPSGLDADTGRGETVVQATWTMTLGLPKRGLLLFPGPEWTGTLYVADIGIPPAAVAAEGVQTLAAEAATVAGWLPQLSARTHKGTRGRVLVVGGSRAMPGAAALAALAALRAGAGLVYAAVPESAGDLVAGYAPEIITWRMPADANGELAGDALPALLELAEGVDAVALGPGLGRGPAGQDLARRLALTCRRPLVLDADGLWPFAGNPTALAAAQGERVLTPHPGEMGQLLGTSATEVERDRPASLSSATVATRATVVLKGAHSLISREGGGFWVNLTGNRVLATAGSGDVLTGTVVALLAQGLSAERAAAAGVFLHGLAGDLIAEQRGGDGILAGEILSGLPAARRRLNAGRVGAWSPLTSLLEPQAPLPNPPESKGETGS